MTGTLYVSFRCSNGDAVMVSKKRYEVYEDEWDMLNELQKCYGCLPWKKENNTNWLFIAEVAMVNGCCEYFIAEFKPNNR
jgi:hypothetical protein